jgi:hypothetical protein
MEDIFPVTFKRMSKLWEDLICAGKILVEALHGGPLF